MTDRPLPELARHLLGDGPLDPMWPAEIAEIRAGSPVVTWFGVNDSASTSRVDIVVVTGDDEWRVVYFTRDGATADSIAVFRRPPRFDGIVGGCAVVVNGPSGAGKSSVLRAIADASPLPWVLFDEPMFGDVAQPYLIW